MKDTRTKLLRTAARLFAQKGFSGTSVRDIITAAGVNVSAINYYFGDKRKLYRETLLHLVTQHRRQVWGPNIHVPTVREISSYSHAQALGLLNRIFDRLLEYNLSSKDLPLERIFTRVELESAPMRKMLLSYMAPFHELPYKLIAKLTSLPEKSPELVVVCHSIFGQLMLSECHRVFFLNKLGVKHLTPDLRQQIKDIIWRNTVTILDSYKKGIKTT